MPPVACNKCRTGWQQPSDSWCLGCSSLEVTQESFRRRCVNPGIRAVAEEAALSCARFVRALGNLDGTLGTGSGGGQPLQLAAKSKPERPIGGPGALCGTTDPLSDVRHQATIFLTVSKVSAIAEKGVLREIVTGTDVPTGSIAHGNAAPPRKKQLKKVRKSSPGRRT